MDFKESNRTYSLAYALGIVCTLLYHSLDCIVYPEIRWKLLIIRILSALFLALMWQITLRSKSITRDRLSVLATIGTAVGITLMCFFSGEGFSSPYYAGNLMIMVVITVFFHFSPTHYTIMVIGIIVQHCVILLFVPWQFKDLALTIYFMLGIAVPGIFVHTLIYKMITEIHTLKDFLPICSYCKKIRDDQGYWSQVEKYVSDHTNVQFSHGICPECAKEVQKEIDNIKL